MGLLILVWLEARGTTDTGALVVLIAVVGEFGLEEVFTSFCCRTERSFDLKARNSGTVSSDSFVGETFEVSSFTSVFFFGDVSCG